MPFSTIQVSPGVNTNATPTLNAAGISASNLIRFRNGLPEKMGGWSRFVGSAMGSITRCLHPWVDLQSNNWLGVGSVQSLKVISNGAVADITPQFLISDVSLNVSTTVGSSIISIVDTNITNLTQYDAVNFNTPITIGGVVLVGSYAIISGSGTSYTFNSGSVATSTVSNAGAVPVLVPAALNSQIINVTFASHNLTSGQTFYFPIPILVGGMTILGSYPVTYISSTQFSISGPSQAIDTNSVTMNGGSAEYLYYIASGPSNSITSGALGPIGQFAIGQGYAVTTVVSGQTGTPITATDWTLDNWGATLLSCPKGGPIFSWTPAGGFLNAIPIGSGPEFNNGIFVAMPQQILVAWGSSKSILPGTCDSSTDPLIIRWSNQNDYTNWQLGYNNLAGSFHLGTGSKIIAGIQGAHNAFIITDTDIYSMGYLGYPLVFGFNQIGTGCGLIGPHAVITMRGVVYWMSGSNFYYTSGASAVSSIPCSVWSTVFQNLDETNAYKCVAGANEDFDEIIFFFPSLTGGAGENDSYAKLNVLTGIWDYGSMNRSAWTGRSFLGPAIGADWNTQYLQQHETGYSDDGNPMDAWYETGYFAYADGENFAVIDHFEPDMKWNTTSGSTSTNASVLVTLTAVDYPSGGNAMTNSLTMTSTTQYLSPRVRGRQAKWKVESNDTTSWWRMGNVRYRYNVDGRR